MAKELTPETLEQIKKFAAENFGREDAEIYADDEEFAVTNPWMDHSGRFPLSDEEAVKEWGLATVLQFCDRAIKYVNQLGN